MGENGMSKDGSLPKMVVFDLDGTLWYPEMYMLWGSGPPFRRDTKTGNVRAVGGEMVKLLGSSRSVLYSLKTDEKFEDTLVGIASRTDEPEWAQECMKQFDVGDGISMKETVDYEAIYGGDKTNHLRELSKRSKVAFEDMIFFDNERGNLHSVQRLGVQCVYTPDGVTSKIWDKALADFKRIKASLAK